MISAGITQLLFVGLLVGTTALFTVLSVLNLRYGRHEVPQHAEWLRTELGIENPQRLLAYERATTSLSLVQSWLLVGVLLVAVVTGVLATVVEWVMATGFSTGVQGALFFAGLVVGYQLSTIPFDLYGTFVIDERFGFNESTPLLWARDFVVELAVSGLLVGALFGVLTTLIDTVATQYWAIGGWVLVVGVSLSMQVLYPRVIAPLFNDFEPITDPELRDAIEGLFDRVGFETSGIYRMDASRRSTRLNAYFVGFGRTKRVVLFDTLIDELDREQLLGVLAHELAHWKRGHIWKRLGAGAVQTGVAFAVLAGVLTVLPLAAAFGVPESAVYGQLFVGLLIVYPVLELTAPLVNRLSLSHEQEADRFAVTALGDGEPMAQALATLARENLANPFPHPWYALFTQSHPPIPERIRAVRSFTSEQTDGT